MTACMEMVFSNGVMVVFTTEISTRVKSRVKAPICGLMARHTKEISSLMSARVREHCTIPMARLLWVHGKMAKSTGLGITLDLTG